MATQIVSSPHVIPFPAVSTTPEPITQLQLELALSLRMAADKAEVNAKAAEQGIKAALQSGAAVEPGIHTASLKENKRRNISWKTIAERLAVRLYGATRGVVYCTRVLAATKPDTTISLILS